MNRIGVMHVIDTLDAGGAERVAVNLVNLLPRARYRPYLCSTREDGGLADSVGADVGRLRLRRKWRFDVNALRHLVSFIRTNDIQIIHTHGTSIFIGVIASLFPPHPAVVWHVHFGRHALENRRAWLYRVAGMRASGVLVVSQPLMEWSLRRLHIPSDQVWYIPNFVCGAESNGKPIDLPGQPGQRIVCVANLRSEKDHLTLLRAMALVIRQVPEAHLLLVGAANDSVYFECLSKAILRLGVDQHVSLLGQRQDVPAILRGCDIGVLSSTSEGFPLSLIEYGVARLAVVATRVGQIPEVLDEGNAGILVSAQAPEQLAEALLLLLKSPDLMTKLSGQLQCRVRAIYSAAPVINQVCKVYDSVLDQR